jgi:hypothetical protein
VSPAPAAATAAKPQLSRRAAQNARTDEKRNRDSLYGARKKNDVGNTHRRRIVVFAARSPNYCTLSEYSTISEPRKATFDKRVASRRGWPRKPSARIASG